MSGTVGVKHRKSVSKGQLEVLKLLYKYRFGSIELLRSSLGLNKTPVLYKKLELLIDQEYVGKRYDSSYRIKGIPAAYYLRTMGFRELQKYPGYEAINDKLVKYAGSKDKIVRQGFIAEVLTVYGVALNFQKLYPELKFFTKRELASQKNFPKNLPDAFISLKASGQEKPNRYFLNVIADSTPRYEVDKLINDYYEFFDNYDWVKRTSSKLPAILLLCESGSYERRLQRWVIRKQGSLDDELEYFTSTLTALNNDQKDIWSSVEEPDELVSLDGISSR